MGERDVEVTGNSNSCNPSLFTETSFTLPGSSYPLVAQTGKGRHVPDLSTAGVVVVGVELVLVQGLIAGSAAVVIGTAAVDGHHLAEERRGWVEAVPAPLAAHRAPLEAARHAS